MADNDMKELTIESLAVPTWLTGLANAVNDTYYYNNNYSFVGCLPSFIRPYFWRYVRPCLNWLDGYVPSLHGLDTGVIATRIGKSLITGLTKTVVGEKLCLKINEEEPTELDKKNFKAASKWVVDKKAIKSVFAGVGWGLASGTSFIKANMKIDGSVWWESVRFDHCAILMDSLGEVREATFLIRNYTETGSNKEAQFFLCEHRFYETSKGKIDSNGNVLETKGQQIPMVEYNVQRVRGTVAANANTPNIKDGVVVKWNEIPNEIKTLIKRDYGVMRIGEPQRLGFQNIAVESLINGLQDLGVPNAQNLGQGMLFEIQDDMIQYEIASTFLLRDMNNGKGTIYMPQTLSVMNQAPNGMPTENPLGGMPNTVEMMKGVDPDTQKAIVQQFDVRVEQWQKAKDDAIRNIAAKWHMSPKIISSYLANGVSQMTATQVDSEDDISISFINLTRSYFVESINRLLETTLNAMGIATNITVSFASPSLVNKDRVIKRQIDLLEKGLTTIDDAIREIYPDLEEEQILRKIKVAKEESEKIKQSQSQEMNFDGTFDDLDKLDIPTESNEKKLNGQTTIDQFTNPN